MKQMKQWQLMLLTLGLALLLAACGGDTGEAVGDELVVQNAWGRTSPAVADNGAFYLTIVNGTDADDELLGATIDVCGAVELHEMFMTENDVMRMQQVPGGTIPIPAGETVTLQAGGLHVMCIGKTAEFEAGQTYDLTLNFANAGERTVTADIRDAEDMPMNMEEEGGMDMEGDG